MKKFRNIGSSLLPGLFLGSLFIVWEIIARKGLVRPNVLPGPTKIIYTLIANLPAMTEHLYVTLFESIIGFAIAILFAIIIALSMDGIFVVKKTLNPIIITSQTVPIFALAPLFTIWFGYGYLPKIVIVILICFFPITISLMEGLGSVDKELLDLLRSMGASKLQIYKMVKIPASLPSFFSGLKISGTYSVIGAVIGEWNGGKVGLGVYMLRVRHSFATDKVFATIILITVLSIGVLKIIQLLEKRMMPWTKYSKDENEEEYV
ncbi:MAG: ABC transporter permease [Bacillota bacterium]